MRRRGTGWKTREEMSIVMRAVVYAVARVVASASARVSREGVWVAVTGWAFGLRCQRRRGYTILAR